MRGGWRGQEPDAARLDAQAGRSERLSAADASNVYIDAADQVNVFLLAGVLGRGGFVGPAGEVDLERLQRAVGERLTADGSVALRRLSQRIVGHRRDLCWEPCAPALGWHVRQVDRVGGRDGLAALCATLMTVPLPQGRPLWELLVVPGASPGGPGLVLRVHHAVADGAAGVGLVQDLFTDPSVAPPSAPAAPVPAPTDRRPWRRRLRALLTGLWRVSAVLRPSVSRTVLLGPISPRRGIGFATADLAALHDRAQAVDATVNDALLSAVTVAARSGLDGAGEATPATLPASVPVALPDRHGSGNAVGVMMVPLPVRQTDGAARLAEISRATRSRRAAARSQGTFELTRTRWGSLVFAWFARRQRFVALFVTNVRGPRQMLHVAGAPLLEAWPVAQIQGNVRLGVSALSYAGRLCCTVHVDAGALAADVMADALGAELRRIAGCRS
jgi:diacylglycerol O-acyltransferase / wax synthase